MWFALPKRNSRVASISGHVTTSHLDMDKKRSVGEDEMLLKMKDGNAGDKSSE